MQDDYNCVLFILELIMSAHHISVHDISVIIEHVCTYEIVSLLCPSKGAEYCDQLVCLSVCVCL